MSTYTEDSLVQQTIAEFLEQELGWRAVSPGEDCGPYTHILAERSLAGADGPELAA